MSGDPSIYGNQPPEFWRWIDDNVRYRDLTEVRALAQSYLDRRDEDWTWVDPEEIKRLARAVLEK